MDFHHLKVFVSVYGNRSFTRAAEKLHISQPTISEHIRNLESELNCKLFDRMGRTIVPTSEADLLYPKAQRILGDVCKLQDDLSSAFGQISGSLVIGASTIPGTYILPSMAADFKKMHKRVSFEILIDDSASITNMVLNHELLVGIVGARMESDHLEYAPFLDDELVLAAVPGLAAKKNLSVEELGTLPFISREDGSGTRKTMEFFLAGKNMDMKDLDVVAVLGSSASVKEAVKAGLGVSILSRQAVRDEIERGVLQEIKIRGLMMRRKFFIINHKKRSLPVRYRTFLRAVQP